MSNIQTDLHWWKCLCDHQLSSPSPVPNPSPKSNIQSQEEREWDWGWQYNLTGHQHHPTHPPITLLTRNVNLVMGKDHPWPSLTCLDLPWPSMTFYHLLYDFYDFLWLNVYCQDLVYRVGHQTLPLISNVQITITPKSKELKTKIRWS